MKNSILTILTLLIFQITALSQPCLPEGIIFTTQSQIDSFQINYPNCTEIEGYVKIQGNAITNLNGLNVLTEIGETLTICGNPNLESLTGLDGLTMIGGDLHIGLYNNLPIIGNPSLTSISALENATSIGGDIQITGNDALLDLLGLHNISTINGGIEICYNASLTSLDDLVNITSIGDHLMINYNESLSSLSGLDNVISIGGHLSISNNPISDLSGIDNITSIGGSLLLSYNEFLGNLNELQNLTFIGENLSIHGNNSLKTLSGLYNITSVGGHLWIVGNDSLTSLTGLENIDPQSISELIINYNPLLHNCEIQSLCEYLSSPNGTVNIYNNANGCNSPSEIAGSCGFTIPCLPFGNYYLLSQQDVSSFQANYPGCTQLEGDVEIRGNDIFSLNGLSEITSVGGTFRIFSNDSLQSLNGLENLTSIGADLEIRQNGNLSNLTGLENITSIGWRLYIGYNDQLTNISGIENINPNTIHHLFITSNSSLCDCDVHSVCDYLAISNSVVDIFYNAPGCNSIEEVQAACDTVSVREIYLENKFTISPNPCSGSVNIRFTIYDPDSYRDDLTILDLFEISGIRIERLLNETKMPGTYEMEFDLGDLPAGVYFCTLKSNEKIQTKKLIIK